MDEFLKNAGSADWWLSVVVAGVLINLASAVLLRRLDKAGITLSGWMRRRSEKKRQQFDRYVAYLLQRPERLMTAYARESRWRLRSVYFVGLGIVVYLIASNSVPLSEIPAWRNVLVTFLSVMVLVAFKLETIADQTAEAAAEVVRRLDGDARQSENKQPSENSP